MGNTNRWGLQGDTEQVGYSIVRRWRGQGASFPPMGSCEPGQWTNISQMRGTVTPAMEPMGCTGVTEAI